MSKAVLFFADGTEECEALLVADLLRRARVEVIIASAMGRRALVSSHGIHLNADALAEDVDYSDVDMVILPGGIPGTPNLAENKTVTDTCVSFCQGRQEGRRHLRRPSVLASLGLLEGRNATAHAGFQDKLAGAIVHDEEVVVDGSITTSYGLGGAIPVCLWSWCASWPAPPRPTASRRLSRIGTEKEAFRCASSPAVCPTAWKTRPSSRRMAVRSGP